MNLFFRKFGNPSDTPLIILHGLLGLSDNWVQIAKMLVENLPLYILIPDQRNHGQSPHHPIFNYTALSNDLENFMEQNSIPSAIILGHSMGGKVAMHYALENPDKVEKLIVADISPVTYKTNRHAELLEYMSDINIQQYKSRKEIEFELENKINDVRLLGFVMKNVISTSRTSYGWRVNLNALKLNLENIFAFEKFSEQYSQNVLFLKGQFSDYILPEYEELIKQFFPNFRIAVIPQAGHWLHVDNQTAFMQQVVAFLQN